MFNLLSLLQIYRTLIVQLDLTTRNRNYFTDVGNLVFLWFLYCALCCVWHDICDILTCKLTHKVNFNKENIFAGATVYLLDLFCNSTNPAVREKTAELFAKMLADKLVGPKVRIILGKFLPVIFMDAMRDSPEASVHMFEGKIIYFMLYSKKIILPPTMIV